MIRNCAEVNAIKANNKSRRTVCRQPMARTMINVSGKALVVVEESSVGSGFLIQYRVS